MLSMIKLTGALTVCFASVMAGALMAKELGDRAKLLREIQQYAIYIKCDMEYRMPVFEECFRARGPVFGTAAKYIKEGVPPREALKKSVSGTHKLRDEDRELLYAYADALDAEDVSGQISNVSLLISRLGESIREADRERGAKGRLYRSGGVLAGIGLVIILL